LFYDTEANAHGLAHDPFKALVAPRPIGWITSVDAAGAINLAPYSFFNAFASRPPIVGFASEGWKDSVSFVAETGEFVCNIVTFDMRQQMNATSAPLPRGVSEFAAAGLDMEPSALVKPPRVKGIAAALECKRLHTVALKDLDGAAIDRWLVLGQVVGIHIDERFVRDGKVDTALMQPIARCGYNEYAVVDKVFSIARPKGG
jgi:flavin reductase (DIM6/NTAB) family NADH-FMN oxidoreductase RutF